MDTRVGNIVFFPGAKLQKMVYAKREAPKICFINFQGFRRILKKRE